MTDHNHWSLGRWRRIPVQMHWTVLLSFAWLYLLLGDLVSMLIGALALFVVFCVHEAGHVAVAKWRRVGVSQVTLNGLHGQTEHADATHKDDVWIAWGGVAAQLILLGVAIALLPVVGAFSLPWLSVLSAPVLFVWIKLNALLILVALLPIGPFDGRAAWQAWRLGRTAMRKRLAAQPAPKPTPEQQQELEAKSEQAARDLLDRVSKRTDRSDKDA